MTFQEVQEQLKAGELETPQFDLTSVDSNAFVLMGGWSGAARQAGWSEEQIQTVIAECTSDDYDHLVQTLISVSD